MRENLMDRIVNKTIYLFVVLKLIFGRAVGNVKIREDYIEDLRDLFKDISSSQKKLLEIKQEVRIWSEEEWARTGERPELYVNPKDIDEELGNLEDMKRKINETIRMSKWVKPTSSLK